MDKRQVIERVRELGLVPVIRFQSPDEASRAIEAIQGRRHRRHRDHDDGAPAPFPSSPRSRSDSRMRSWARAPCSTPSPRGPASWPEPVFAGEPALDLGTIECCRRYGIAVLPGALTPTEVLSAWQAGADIVKVFPAGALGGASYIKALKAPFPQIDLIPTGVSVDTAPAFIQAGRSPWGWGPTSWT